MDEPGLFVDVQEGGYGVQAGIYPIRKEGQNLRAVVDGIIEHLPQKSVTESDQYIRGYGRTTSAGGYTPIETQWIKITIHKGTGIVTTASSYYNNNEYSITRSGSMLLKEASFDLEERVAPLPESPSITMLILMFCTIGLGQTVRLGSTSVWHGTNPGQLNMSSSLRFSLWIIPWV